MSALRRQIIVLAMLAGTIFATAGAPLAVAAPMQWRYEFYYFSDSAYTTLIGAEIGGCLPGESYRWGETSEYRTTCREPCFA